jgi:hypothetical protein
MKTTRIGFALLWMLLVLISDCRKNPSGFTHGMKADGVPVYLSHRDYGCEKELPLSKVRLLDDRIEAFSCENDTLSFTVRFGYVCCSAFSDSMSADTGRIEIDSRDIATDHCRCMCVYYKDFVFLHAAKTPVRIVFSLQPWPPSPNETLIDTLLNIQ